MLGWRQTGAPHQAKSKPHVFDSISQQRKPREHNDFTNEKHFPNGKCKLRKQI